MKVEVLDVRPLPPRDRHRLIFERLDGLAVGDTLRLVNDHDPRPLRYQLDAERPDQFRWEAFEEGPERWAFDITARARVVDARPILARGEEPFDTIMDAAAAVRDGEILVVYASFEPVPPKGPGRAGLPLCRRPARRRRLARRVHLRMTPPPTASRPGETAMPAETHQQHEPVDTAAVLELLWALLARPDDPGDLLAATTLGDLADAMIRSLRTSDHT